MVNIALFTANVTGSLLLEKLEKSAIYPKVVTYDTAFRKTSLSRNFGKFENKFNIIYLSNNKFEHNKEILSKLNCDIGICIDWTKDFFKNSIPPFDVLHMQPSLLPKYRGYGCISEQFEKGVYTSGITFYKDSDTVDGGNIVYQEEIRIEFEDYPMDFIDSIAKKSAEFIIRLKNEDLGHFPEKEQNPEEAFYIIRKRKKHALIDFNRDAYSIYNHIRAYSRPFFGAFFYINGRKITVFNAMTEKWQGYFGAPGKIIKNDENGAEIACGSGTINLTEVETGGHLYRGYIPL